METAAQTRRIGQISALYVPEQSVPCHFGLAVTSSTGQARQSARLVANVSQSGIGQTYGNNERCSTCSSKGVCPASQLGNRCDLGRLTTR